MRNKAPTVSYGEENDKKGLPEINRQPLFVFLLISGLKEYF